METPKPNRTLSLVVLAAVALCALGAWSFLPQPHLLPPYVAVLLHPRGPGEIHGPVGNTPTHEEIEVYIFVDKKKYAPFITKGARRFWREEYREAMRPRFAKLLAAEPFHLTEGEIERILDEAEFVALPAAGPVELREGMDLRTTIGDRSLPAIAGPRATLRTAADR